MITNVYGFNWLVHSRCILKSIQIGNETLPIYLSADNIMKDMSFPVVCLSVNHHLYCLSIQFLQHPESPRALIRSERDNRLKVKKAYNYSKLKRSLLCS